MSLDLSAHTASPVQEHLDVHTLLDWTTDEVSMLCEAIGLGDHCDALHQHAIDGAAIAAADHETLRDLGFRTVGHRLSLLRAVYDIKCREGLPIEDDWLPPYERFTSHYRPSSDEEDDLGPTTPRSYEHTAVLEAELRVVRNELSALHSYVDNLAHKVLATETSLAELAKARPRSGGGGKPSLSVDTIRASRRSPRSSRAGGGSKRAMRLAAGGIRSPSLGGGASSVPPSPSEPDTATPTPGQSPTWISSTPCSPAPGAKASGRDDSLSPPASRKQQQQQQQWSPKTPLSATARRAGLVIDHPASPRADRDRRAQPLYGSPSGFQQPVAPPPAIANTPPTPATSEPEAVLTPSTGGGLASANVRSFGDAALERPGLSRQGSASSGSTSSRSRSGDTCMQILPAAVKKYQLKASWHEYVMCARRHLPSRWPLMLVRLVSSPALPAKRALSYDERPRVVVDELKAQDLGPVSCLVQHQSELRSPLALAVSRRQKAFRRLVEEQGRSASGAATEAAAATTASRTELPRQVLPVACASPELRTTFRIGGIGGGGAPAKYGLAVFPYAAERAEEIDVEHGEALSILGRDPSDQYLIVQRSDASGKPIRSGSIPACCVLELLVPASSLSSASSSTSAVRALEPVSVASPHVVAYALVDRPAHNAGELELHRDDRLRLYFRCSHWVWAIVERTGQRGWAPGWLVSSTAGEQASLPRSSGSVSRKTPSSSSASAAQPISPGLRGS